jgi:hypothetical protein
MTLQIRPWSCRPQPALVLGVLLSALAGCGPERATSLPPAVLWRSIPPPAATAAPAPAAPVAVDAQAVVVDITGYRLAGAEALDPLLRTHPEGVVEDRAPLAATIAHAEVVSHVGFTLYAQQTAAVSFLTDYAYIDDYRRVDAILEPTIAVLRLGAASAVRAHAVGDAVVIDGLRVRTQELQGVSTTVGRYPWRGALTPYPVEEPTLLAWEAARIGSAVTLARGQALVLPAQYWIERHLASGLRQLAYTLEPPHDAASADVHLHGQLLYVVTAAPCPTPELLAPAIREVPARGCDLDSPVRDLTPPWRDPAYQLAPAPSAAASSVNTSISSH